MGQPVVHFEIMGGDAENLKPPVVSAAEWQAAHEQLLARRRKPPVGPALLATLEPGQFISTLDLKSSFLQPAYPAGSPAMAALSTATATATSPSSRAR